jgi:hypothetical protein
MLGIKTVPEMKLRLFAAFDSIGVIGHLISCKYGHCTLHLFTVL